MGTVGIDVVDLSTFSNVPRAGVKYFDTERKRPLGMSIDVGLVEHNAAGLHKIAQNVHNNLAYYWIDLGRITCSECGGAAGYGATNVVRSCDSKKCHGSMPIISGITDGLGDPLIKQEYYDYIARAIVIIGYSEGGAHSASADPLSLPPPHLLQKMISGKPGVDRGTKCSCGLYGGIYPNPHHHKHDCDQTSQTGGHTDAEPGSGKSEA